nr:RhuM family protein [Prosthecochloris ethylica]
MQSFDKKGLVVGKADVGIAKNYLNQDEITLLGLIVEQYLAFAEAMAQQRTPMYMKDWIQRLDSIIQLNGRELLTHAGKISHKLALGYEYLTPAEALRERKGRMSNVLLENILRTQLKEINRIRYKGSDDYLKWICGCKFFPLEQMRCGVERSSEEIEVAVREIRLIFPSRFLIL